MAFLSSFVGTRGRARSTRREGSAPVVYMFVDTTTCLCWVLLSGETASLASPPEAVVRLLPSPASGEERSAQRGRTYRRGVFDSAVWWVGASVGRGRTPPPACSHERGHSTQRACVYTF